MSPLEVGAVVADVTVRAALGVLLAGLLVWLLLLAVRPTQAAVRYIAPGAGQAVRDVLDGVRARHEAGRARVAAYDEAQARREALQLRRVA